MAANNGRHLWPLPMGSYLRNAEAARWRFLTRRDFIKILARPNVRQSGQTQLPARSKPPRILGRSMHQQ